MAELDTQDREELKDSQYAYIDKNGERKLPVNDEEHVRNAIARFSQTDFEGNSSARKDAARKIIDRAHDYGIDVSDDDDVKKAVS